MFVEIFVTITMNSQNTFAVVVAPLLCVRLRMNSGVFVMRPKILAVSIPIPNRDIWNDKPPYSGSFSRMQM